MKKIISLLLLSVISGVHISCAQEKAPFSIHPESFQVDPSKKIIVLNIDAIESDPETPLSTITLDTTYHFETPIASLSNSEVYPVSVGEEQFSLYVTKSPILSITVKDDIVDFPKKNAEFHYYDADTTFTSAAGIELRGNLSLTYPKKSFNVEFYTDTISKGKKEIDFKDLRKEDDWILDGLYNEPLFVRANFSQTLWKDMYEPHYASEEPKARSTIDGFYADLFIDGEYRGVYFFSEKINRSLLKLKKMKDGVANGLLFKASNYVNGTAFKGAPEFNNNLPMWGGFEMKYPFEDYVAHYDDFYKAVKFVAESNPKAFEAEIDSYFVVDNLMNYFLYINLIRATDNLGKNYYMARYDKETPFFIVPWDLDGVLGTIQDGKRIATTNDILSNNLFDRLWNENPNNYRSKAITRWKELRRGEFSDEKISNRIEENYLKLKENNFYERDAKVWNVSHDEENLTYLKEWLENRLLYLDGYFKE
ncbi:CotH kinase family protein [Cochleicola gelatinilyticus]|uniref:Spore coat protein CotH n=1 Tax=Cochleicola gelatinilyticus TaxID=1763537 RepID=A0A167GW33_9FLAO|nr:CotH kinase family protein [Cochleicola gelatinilyticus]OAB77962.1 hypothetical protein ULVI_10765 [Cochleicola gelatinilyticus]